MAGKLLYAVQWRTPQSVLAQGWRPERDETYRCFAEYEQAQAYIQKTQEEALHDSRYAFMPHESSQIGMPHVACIGRFRGTEEQVAACERNGYIMDGPQPGVQMHPFRACFAADAALPYKAYHITGNSNSDLREYAQARIDAIQQENYRVMPHLAKGFSDKHIAYAVLSADTMSPEDILQPIDSRTVLCKTPEAAIHYAQESHSHWARTMRFSAQNVPNGFKAPKGVSLSFEVQKPCIVYPVKLSEESAQQLNWGSGQLGRIGSGAHHVDYCRMGNPFIVLHDGEKQHIIAPDEHESPRMFMLRATKEIQDFQEQLQQKANALYVDYRKQYDADRHAQAFESRETSFGANQEMPHPGEANAGWRLISRLAQTLEEKGYPEHAKELRLTYSRNVERSYSNTDDSKQAAYKAMESVFSKVQRDAAKKGDFQTATAAQHVVRGASDALDDMRQSSTPKTGMSREDAAREGINIPEEEEVCV